MRALLCGIALAALSSSARAERLAFRSFGVAQGLAHPRVISIARDARGFLWVGTWEGLCRFDGRSFTRYGTRDGLGNPLVVAIAEDTNGRLWFATHGAGVARFVDDPRDAVVDRPGFAPAARSAFVSSSPAASVGAGVASSLACDAEGRLWCATEASFFRAAVDARGEPRFEPVGAVGHVPRPRICLVDSAGAAVLLTNEALERASGEQIVAFPRELDTSRGDLVAAARIAPDRWAVAHALGVDECELPLDPRAAPRWTRADPKLPEGARITALATGAQGELWIGTTRGLIRRAGGAERWITRAEGLADEQIRALCADADGSLWIGTLHSGLLHLGDEAVVRYDASEIGDALDLARVVEGPVGAIYASSNDRGLFRLEGSDLRRVPGSDAFPFVEAHLRVLCDRRGDWWIGTEDGLFRSAGPTPQLANAERAWPPSGEPGRSVFSELRELASGAIVFAAEDATLFALERGADGRFEAHGTALDAKFARSPVRTWCTDRAGAEWLATFDELLRRRGPSLERIEGASGLPSPASRPRALLVDSRGWLWIGLRFEGLRVCEDPAADAPSFRALTSADGLPSDAVWGLAEDGQGRIYAGTGRGLVRFDPAGGTWRSFGDVQVVNHVLCDSSGIVWAATSGGLLRLDPEHEAPATRPARVFVQSISLAGRALDLPARGAARVLGVVIAPGADNLVVEYAAADLSAASELRFQHRLAGADSEWSAPSERTAVHYASLVPGHYRFEVRALDGAGRASGDAAVIELEVLAPLWRRGWFVALVAGALGALGYALHRARLRRALALERVRTQIATDLHDDLGAGLAQIAILSEVARRSAEPRLASTLAELAGLARSMRESMAEIVWAIDPRRDKLLDLVRRMRQVAANLLESAGIEVEFDAPPDEQLNAVGLAPEERRQLLLFFKEAVTNVARHARASRVWVRVESGARSLRLSVRDDGCGFDPGAPSDGQGLANLRKRAGATRGELHIRSEPGAGCRIDLVLGLGGA